MKKEDLIRYAQSLGAVRVGFAEAKQWHTAADVPSAFYPDALWPQTKTVIVLLIPTLLAIDETKISDLHRAQYHTLNRILDDAAYRLALYLNKRGAASIHIGRDGYGTQAVLRQNPVAAFSHVYAGYYAGLGTIGWNHMLLTPEYGPRHRIVSVLTAEEFEGDAMQEKNLCIGCRICERFCPTHSFSPKEEGGVGSDMNKISCALQSFDQFYNHCSFCVKCCPIGEDRTFFGGASTAEHRRAHEDYAQWHMGLGGALTPESRGTVLALHACAEQGDGSHAPHTEIEMLATELGSDAFGIVPVPVWEDSDAAKDLQGPALLWPQARAVVVVAVRGMQQHPEQADRLLNEIVCRVSNALIERGFPSVYIPAGDLSAAMPPGAPVLLFDHAHAANLAGIHQPELHYASVLTTYLP